MKRVSITMALAIALFVAPPATGRAQSVSQCLEQLALDYQKLSSLKQLLSQLYTDYAVLAQGYQAVKGAAQGNFGLHKAFLDGLLAVSPAIRQYPRVGDIIRQESLLLADYHAAWKSFRSGGQFSPGELAHMLSVYDGLLAGSLKALTDLAMVLSDNQMRMNDAERLAAVDRIFAESKSRLDFLHNFNENNYRLASGRSQEEGQRQALKNLYRQ
jgi:hypothetical protein